MRDSGEIDDPADGVTRQHASPSSRRRPPVHEQWGAPESLLWLPVTAPLVEILFGPVAGSDPPRRLTGIQMALILHLAAIWRFQARAPKFTINTVRLAKRLGVSRSCVYENLRALRRAGLLDVVRTPVNNQLGIDMEVLRRAVAGSPTPLRGSPRGVGPYELWGHTPDCPTPFWGVPVDVLTWMCTGADVDETGACPVVPKNGATLRRPQEWKVLLYVVVAFLRGGTRVFDLDVSEAAERLGMPPRSVRRALAELLARGVVAKVGLRRRGLWRLDVTALCEEVADVEAGAVNADSTDAAPKPHDPAS